MKAQGQLSRQKKDGLNRLYSCRATLSHVMSAFPGLDELVEAVPGIAVFVLGQVVVEGRFNGFDVGFYML